MYRKTKNIDGYCLLTCWDLEATHLYYDFNHASTVLYNTRHNGSTPQTTFLICARSRKNMFAKICPDTSKVHVFKAATLTVGTP